LLYLIRSHVNLVKFLFKFTPNSAIINLEYAKFDTSKLTGNSNVIDLDTNKAYVLSRDKHTCQSCGCSGPMQVHHIHPRSQGGTDQINNLITVCPKCHSKIHKGKMEAPPIKEDKQQRPTTLNSAMPEIYRQLQELSVVEINFGVDTKLKRRQLDIEKTHSKDAFICTLLGIKSPKIIDFKIDVELMSHKRHHRAKTQRIEDRKYYIPGTKKCVARNKNKRTGQDTDSLIEFRKANKNIQVVAKPGGRVFYTHKLTAPFKAGDIVSKDGVIYLVKSFSTTQSRIYHSTGFCYKSRTEIINKTGGIKYV
jgi:hypothetical protein